MKSRDLSFLVLGAGAVGGITAALLKKNGYNVEIVCKYDDYASHISEHGLNIKGTCGNFSIKLPAYSSAKLLKSKKDVILHATKATDMIDAAVDSAFLLKDDGCFVSLQNGIVEDDLIKVAGSKRVIGCVTGWGATMESQGNLVMTSAGDFILGYPDRPPDEYLSLVAEALSSVVPVKITTNIMGHLYSKLIIIHALPHLGLFVAFISEKCSQRRRSERFSLK
jgi:2-dehydropantoate 2-reductase